jgi:invasion protein IalB
MKKVTLALSAASALAAVTIGLAAPAMAAPITGASPLPAASVGANHGGFPLDCSVHVLYQGADVDVNWC